MARSRIKWKCVFLSFIILLNVFTKSLPVNTKLSSLSTTDTVFKSLEIPVVTEAVKEFADVYSETVEPIKTVVNETVKDFADLNGDATVESKNVTFVKAAVNATRDSTFSPRRSDVRPGQEVRTYSIEITVNGNSFTGRALLDVSLTSQTRYDPIKLHTEGLNVDSVQVGVFSGANAVDVPYNVDDGILEIEAENLIAASTYIVIIEYSADFSIDGYGLHLGQSFNDATYLAMNLHPTYARRVFPCMDEPTEVSIINFTFNNVPNQNLISNSILEENSNNEFRGLQGPPHLWGMMAHDFITINVPVVNVQLFGRQGLAGQENQASLAINYYFTNLIEWTNKPYFEIILNQRPIMHIVTVPDVDRDWHALSTVRIWEPYVFMEISHSVKQRKTALAKIGEAIAKQWFGYVIFPQNWRYEWVVSGLASYAGYEMMRGFQDDSASTDVTLLDANSIFVADVIQESLYWDSYLNSRPLEPADDMFDEGEIRDHIHGLVKYKAPAFLRMLRLVLGDEENDFVQSAGQALLNGRALQAIDSLSFIDALNSNWLANGNGMIEDIAEFLEDWVFNNGYPFLRVTSLTGAGVLITMDRFGVPGDADFIDYEIPITYTTSNDPDFTNIYPTRMMTTASLTLSLSLDVEDWILFNIQGQGYYRVTYDENIWNAIIEALEDPEEREKIHPLNRATLVDDALSLARMGILDYETAFRVVLTMEHEKEYPVWKAFVRNMDFLRKRLVAYVGDDEDLDPDIYLRMVRRTVVHVENELGFRPDTSLIEPAMDTMTRGLVMDHACRANYQPCIAAAVDWFYDPNNNDPVVNPNIPHELRPAVYCTMVREGDSDITQLLYDRLDIEASQYERIVILESLACSQDETFINNLLQETISAGSRYLMEERVKIFKAVAESSSQNARIALNFIRNRAPNVRDMYGGPQKFEEILYALAENMADGDLSADFGVWVNAQNNQLDDCQMAGERAFERVQQNRDWDNANMDEVYEWIDENHAPTLILSVVALCVSLMVAFLNH